MSRNSDERGQPPSARDSSPPYSPRVMTPAAWPVKCIGNRVAHQVAATAAGWFTTTAGARVASYCASLTGEHQATATGWAAWRAAGTADQRVGHYLAPVSDRRMSCRRPAERRIMHTARATRSKRAAVPRSWCRGRADRHRAFGPTAWARAGRQRPGRGGDPRITHPVQCGTMARQLASSGDPSTQPGRPTSHDQRGSATLIAARPRARRVRHLATNAFATPGGPPRAGNLGRASATTTPHARAAVAPRIRLIAATQLVRASQHRA